MRDEAFLSLAGVLALSAVSCSGFCDVTGDALSLCQRSGLPFSVLLVLVAVWLAVVGQPLSTPSAVTTAEHGTTWRKGNLMVLLKTGLRCCFLFFF